MPGVRQPLDRLWVGAKIRQETKVRLSRRGAEEISAWGMTLYGALLPFHALGVYRSRTSTGFELCDALLTLAAPAVFVQLWRWRRRWLASPVVLGVLWLSLAYLLTETLEPAPSRARLIQSLLPFVALGGAACTSWSGQGARVVRGLLVGGGVALAVAALGYAATLGFGPSLPGAFVFQSQHPIFGRVPRLTGTFGAHAGWLGEYCLMLLAVALGASDQVCSRAVRSVLRVAAALALLATFSFAWLGGLLLLTQGAYFRRWPAPWRRGAAAAFAIVYAVASWVLVVGLPVDLASSREPRPCSNLDAAHHVVRVERPGWCQPIVSEAPYPHRLTLYELAHRTALASVQAHPGLGLGHRSYRDFAIAHAERAAGLREGGFYREAVGLYAATLAHSGALGAFGLGVLLFGVARLFGTRRPGVETEMGQGGWALAGSLALLVTATQTDLELRGPLWILLGLAIAGLPAPGAFGPGVSGGVSTGRCARNPSTMLEHGE